MLNAKHNYDKIQEEQVASMKPQIIDTYGYVKMAFEARKDLPDFDEIEQAKALFQEALTLVKRLPDSNRYAIESKRIAKQTFQFHLQKADRVLASR